MGTLFEACKKSVGLDLVLHTKAKDNDGGEQMDSLLQAIKEADENPAIIGVLNKVCYPTRDLKSVQHCL